MTRIAVEPAVTRVIGEGLRSHTMRADTFTLQARGFYERWGRAVFGVLDYPGGVQRFSMRKSLAPA